MGRRPTHTLVAHRKGSDVQGSKIGVAWSNRNGSFRIVLDPCVTISHDSDFYFNLYETGRGLEEKNLDDSDDNLFNVNGRHMVREDGPVGSRLVGDVMRYSVQIDAYVRSAMGEKPPTKKEVEDVVVNALLSTKRLDEGADWDVASVLVRDDC